MIFIWPQPYSGLDSNISGSLDYIWCHPRKDLPVFRQMPGVWLSFPSLPCVAITARPQPSLPSSIRLQLEFALETQEKPASAALCLGFPSLGSENFVPGPVARAVKGLAGNDVIQTMNSYSALYSGVTFQNLVNMCQS